VLRRATDADRARPAFPQTTMTCYIHLLRLRIIDSEIQHDIYRVDNRNSAKTIYQTTDDFLERLSAWRDAIPPQSTHSSQPDPTNRNNFRGDEYRSYDSYVCGITNDICLYLSLEELMEKTNKIRNSDGVVLQKYTSFTSASIVREIN
jgi:hypothetical protein